VRGVPLEPAVADTALTPCLFSLLGPSTARDITQVVVNKLRTYFFQTEPAACGGGCQGIYRGTYFPTAALGVWPPDAPWAADGVKVNGIALSPDGSILFYSTSTNIFQISASAAVGAAGTQIGPTASGNTVFRGVTLAPVTPSCGVGVAGSCCTPGMPGCESPPPSLSLSSARGSTALPPRLTPAFFVSPQSALSAHLDTRAQTTARAACCR